MNIGIVGLGLIGASFARTVKKFGKDKVYGRDIDQSVMKRAEELSAIDFRLTEDNASEIDLLVVALYPKDFYETCKRFLPYMRSGATVMDFCGNKRIIAEKMKTLAEKYPSFEYIGGHPMAGREVSGIDASKDDLFLNASMIFTPVSAGVGTIEKFKNYFLSLGFGEVVITTPENHDKNVAFTSQLCHVVSNAFIKSPTAKKHFGYSAGSYKDLTRVAALSPEMWAELMSENRDNLSEELDILIENLEKYSSALKTHDTGKLRTLLAEGNDIKKEIDKGK